MKKHSVIILMTAVWVITAPRVWAQETITFGESNLNQLIPDEEFIERWTILSGIVDQGPYTIQVSFKIVPDETSGGMWNGDYSAYLIHTAEPLPGTNSLTAVLINRVGRDTNLPSGYDGNGIDITLRDDGLSNVHTYLDELGGFLVDTNGAVTGTGIPDGRLVSPSTVVTGDPVTNLLNELGNRDPNGKWQFKIGDMEAGFQGRLESWSVTLTPVIPEPSIWALLALGIGTVAFALRRKK